MLATLLNTFPGTLRFGGNAKHNDQQNYQVNIFLQIRNREEKVL